MSAEAYEKAAADALNELWDAKRKFPSFHSPHEGYAVLLEEVDELWDEVRSFRGAKDKTHMRAEAIQVAAMAIRFSVDCCGGAK